MSNYWIRIRCWHKHRVIRQTTETEINTIWNSSSLTIPLIRWRVVWDLEVMMEIFSPTNRFMDELTDLPARFFVTEIIREKILLNYEKEVPYSVEVEVEEFKEDPKRPWHREWCLHRSAPIWKTPACIPAFCNSVWPHRGCPKIQFETLPRWQSP